jgi:biopolymer transport protein ExbD
MAGARIGGDDELMTEINILPLVDIILVVLIIFMVTTSYIVSPSIKLNLPDAATGDATAPSSLGISVLADRSILLDGKPVTETELRAAVRAAHDENPDVVCLIAGDENARHGDVTHIIDLVKQEKVAKFAINIDSNATPPEIGAAPAVATP